MHSILLRLAALLVVVGLARAGDDCLSGSSCNNECPLAKQANARLADGREAVTSSKLVRAAIVRAVFANMEAL
jgi:hypothetical protein